LFAEVKVERTDSEAERPRPVAFSFARGVDGLLKDS